MLLGTQAYSSVTRPIYNTVSAAQNHKQQLFVTEIIMHSELHNCSFILDTGLKCTTFILLCSFTSAVEIQDRQTSFNIWGTKNFNPYRFSGRSEPRGPMIRMRAYCISFFFFKVGTIIIIFSSFLFFKSHLLLLKFKESPLIIICCLTLVGLYCQ